MSEIADLESRLSAALDRIAQGLENVSAAPDAPADQPDASEESEGVEAKTSALKAEIEMLQDALAQERHAKEILVSEVERLQNAPDTPASVAVSDEGAIAEIAALKAAHAAEIAGLQEAVAEERKAWEGLNSRVVRMRRSNKLMRSNTIALRQAAADQTADAELINQSLQLELDAVMAAQELERAEVDVVLKTLQPLLGEPVATEETGETA